MNNLTNKNNTMSDDKLYNDKMEKYIRNISNSKYIFEITKTCDSDIVSLFYCLKICH